MKQIDVVRRELARALQAARDTLFSLQALGGERSDDIVRGFMEDALNDMLRRTVIECWTEYGWLWDNVYTLAAFTAAVQFRESGFLLFANVVATGDLSNVDPWRVPVERCTS